MQAPGGGKFWQKILVFWLIFMAMYFAYKFFPVFPLSLICATNESNFQHYKAGFFAYLLANLVEYGMWRRQIPSWETWLFSRLAATIFLPWLMFLVWYIAPAVYGRWDYQLFEIIYANVVTLIVGFLVAAFERDWEQIKYSVTLQNILLVLFVVSIALYLIFTFKLPWADVFVEPNWR